jgi:hypothetical protein
MGKGKILFLGRDNQLKNIKDGIENFEKDMQYVYESQDSLLSKFASLVKTHKKFRP